MLNVQFSSEILVKRVCNAQGSHQGWANQRSKSRRLPTERSRVIGM